MQLHYSLSLTFVILFGLFCFWIGANFSNRYYGNTDLVYHELENTNQYWSTQTDVCPPKFTKFCEIEELLSKELVYDSGLNITGMIEKSLHGYVEWIWEPYTEYFTPEENKVFLGDLQGDRKFEGIGAVVSKKTEGIVIQEIIKWSPAYQAWLKPKDIVVMIDDKVTKWMSIFDSIGYIRGTGGTEVKLTIMRMSENRLFEVKVRRDKVNVPSVLSQVYNTWGLQIGHITISILWEDTVASFARIANELKHVHNIDALIVDLRGNGGGILDSAVDIASHFVSTQFRSLSGQSYGSRGYMTFEKIPVVVLIDEMSASAAEVLTLALKHYLHTPIIGKKSFGKGSIQTMTFLKDYSSIKYTIGTWFGPDKVNINHSGIVPDYQVALNTTGFVYSGIDTQLEFAQQLLVSNHTSTHQSGQQDIPQTLTDYTGQNKSP